MSLTAEILIVLALILANGFFSAAEIAILTARRNRLEQQAEAGNRASRVALELARDPNRFLPTVQVGITVVSTVAATLGGARIVDSVAMALGRVPNGFIVEHREAIGLALVAMTISFLSLLIGELVPKRLALAGAEGLARFVAVPMQQLARVARPVVWVMAVATDGVLFLLGQRGAVDAGVSVEDIDHLIKTGATSGVLEPAEQRVARRALRLGDRTVTDVMRPRIDIDAVDVNTPPEEVIGAVAMAGFSRLPVHEGDLDRIIGFVYTKDLLRQQHLGWDMNLRKLVRPALFVPETMRVDTLLELFRQKRTQMAIVLDEYGGTDGLVTLEDVLEELVGEIHDEHRLDRQQEIVQRDPASWLVDGTVNLDNLLERIGRVGLRSDDEHDFSTVAGLIFALLERIPRVGDRAVWHDLELEVVDMDGPRIDRVLINVRPAEAEDAASAG